MASSVLHLAITLLVILGAAWLIIWIIQMFIAIPDKIQKFIWVLALLLCLYKAAVWAGF